MEYNELISKLSIIEDMYPLPPYTPLSYGIHDISLDIYTFDGNDTLIIDRIIRLNLQSITDILAFKGMFIINSGDKRFYIYKNESNIFFDEGQESKIIYIDQRLFMGGLDNTIYSLLELSPKNHVFKWHDKVIDGGNLVAVSPNDIVIDLSLMYPTLTNEDIKQLKLNGSEVPKVMSYSIPVNSGGNLVGIKGSNKKFPSPLASDEFWKDYMIVSSSNSEF